MRLDDRVCSGWFAAEQDLRQGRMPEPPLLPSSRRFINLAHTRFKADNDSMDALVHLKKKMGAGLAGGKSRWRASPGYVAVGHTSLR